MAVEMHPAAIVANDLDPYVYRRGNFPRSPVEAILVAVLRPTRFDRALQLIPEKSRCIRAGDIHELILTDETTAQPGIRVNRVAYLGFAEFTKGGLIVQDDILEVDGQSIGRVVGYDETHMPNHINIVVVGENFASGYDRGLALGARLTFSTALVDHRTVPHVQKAI